MSNIQDRALNPLTDDGAEAAPDEQVVSLLTRALSLLDASDGPTIIRARLADLLTELREADQED